MSVFHQKRIVCFGGGTGLPALLSGLKRCPTLNVTAIVSMFDSGGSSGVLRDRFGILPPGDILKCLLALSEDEQTARRILLKRIQHRESPGHTGGNVLLMALEKVYGNYLSAVDALGQILSIQGRVVPVALQPATLCAHYKDGSTACGETHVDEGLIAGKEVRELFLEPTVRASDSALQAIQQADLLCVGPGSFYTSVLPNFLPDGVRQAVAGSSAPIVFIANLVTEGLGMQQQMFMDLINQVEHALGRPFSSIIMNAQVPVGAPLDRYGEEHKYPILPAAELLQDPRLIVADLWRDNQIARHDSATLADLILALAQGNPSHSPYQGRI